MDLYQGLDDFYIQVNLGMVDFGHSTLTGCGPYFQKAKLVKLPDLQ